MRTEHDPCTLPTLRPCAVRHSAARQAAGRGWDLWTDLDLLYFITFWFNPFLSSPLPPRAFCSLVHPCPPQDKFSYILDKTFFVLPWLCHGLKRKSIAMPAGCRGTLAICAIALTAPHATHLQT